MGLCDSLSGVVSDYVTVPLGACVAAMPGMGGKSDACAVMLFDQGDVYRIKGQLMRRLAGVHTEFLVRKKLEVRSGSVDVEPLQHKYAIRQSEEILAHCLQMAGMCEHTHATLSGVNVQKMKAVTGIRRDIEQQRSLLSRSEQDAIGVVNIADELDAALVDITAATDTMPGVKDYDESLEEVMAGIDKEVERRIADSLPAPPAKRLVLRSTVPTTDDLIGAYQPDPPAYAERQPTAAGRVYRDGV